MCFARGKRPHPRRSSGDGKRHSPRDEPRSRRWGPDTGSLAVPWGTGHPVGYWAHDAGTGLNRRETRPLVEGQVLAFDSLHAWALDGSTTAAWGDGTKSFSSEEMAVITANGAEYLVAPQQKLILSRSR